LGVVAGAGVIFAAGAGAAATIGFGVAEIVGAGVAAATTDVAGVCSEVGGGLRKRKLSMIPKISGSSSALPEFQTMARIR
jgi:hypothetical protein